MDWMGILQSLNEPFGFLFILTQPLMKASFQRVLVKINNPAVGGIHLSFAERGGFEPPVRRKADNGFRDRRIRPLCHLSKISSRFSYGVYPALAGPPLPESSFQAANISNMKCTLLIPETTSSNKFNIIE
jgi:hypothetical protein